MNPESIRQESASSKIIPLEKEIVEKGDFFVKSIEQISSVPNLEFKPNSIVFVCIPVYLELENIQRLFESWNSQELPEGVSIEVVICINQKTDNPEDFDENMKTAELLQDLYEKNKKENIQFHFIDKFKEESRLEGNNNIGDIRNILSASVIKSVLDNPRNGIILSTDADTFPTSQCAMELYKKFEESTSVYGSVDKNIEFSSEIPENEKEKIKQLFILGDIHEVLLEYFSSGEMVLPESMGAGGTGFFASIDKFIEVSGYSSMDFGEDTDLLNKLYGKNPEDFKPITTTELSNTIRFSDRLDGDGALISELRKNNYPANCTLEITIAHAKARKWFSNAIVEGLSFKEAVDSFNFGEYSGILSVEEINDLKQVINSEVDGTDDDERLGNLLQSLLKRLYEIKKESIDSALSSYVTFIEDNFLENERFQTILKKHNHPNGDISVIEAFIEFVITESESSST